MSSSAVVDHDNQYSKMFGSERDLDIKDEWERRKMKSKINLPQIINNKYKNQINLDEHYMLNKLSNMNFETKMNTKKKQLEETLEEKKSYREILTHQLVSLQKEIDDLKVDLDYYMKCFDEFQKKRYVHVDQNSPKYKLTRRMTKSEEEEMNVVFIQMVHVLK